MPGNGSTLATHADRKRLSVEAGHLIVDITKRHYEQDEMSVLPRNIATKAAFKNAMALDVAMGGSTNTVLHILAIAHEGEVNFKMADIDAVSRRVPVLCKVAPAKQDVHMEDVHRAGGIMVILGQLDGAGLLNPEVPTIHARSIGAAVGGVIGVECGGHGGRRHSEAGDFAAGVGGGVGGAAAGAGPGGVAAGEGAVAEGVAGFAGLCAVCVVGGYRGGSGVAGGVRAWAFTREKY